MQPRTIGTRCSASRARACTEAGLIGCANLRHGGEKPLVCHCRRAIISRDKFGSLITPWHVCRGTLRQCHLDECQRTPALSPPSRQAAYKRSPFRSNSRQLRCVDIKFFRSNGSSAVHFVNSANHRCGLPALSLMNRITISGPLNARRVQTSR